MDRLALRAQNEKRKACGLAEIGGQGLQSTLQRGWYYGAGDFKEELLDVAGRSIKKLVSSPFGQKSYRGAEVRDHGEREAEAVLNAGLSVFGLTPAGLAASRKGAPEKALIAREIRRRTSVPLSWITGRLQMGTTANIRRACQLLEPKLKSDRSLRKLESKFMRELPA